MPISNPSLPSVPDRLHVDDLMLEEDVRLITARTIAGQASCRTYSRPSTRVHSSYWRTFKDLPRQDRAVTWRVQVRRFRCGHCLGRIFAERVPGDHVRVSVLADAESVLRRLPLWLAHYNELHPHRALGYRLPREFIARSTQEALSGL